MEMVTLWHKHYTAYVIEKLNVQHIHSAEIFATRACLTRNLAPIYKYMYEFNTGLLRAHART